MTFRVRMIDVEGRVQGIDSHGICYSGGPRFSPYGAHC